jgi:hypothetical protein
MIELASSSAQADLAHSAFFSVYFLFPTLKIQKLFSDKIKPIEIVYDLFYEENKLLIKLKEILLSKLANSDFSERKKFPRKMATIKDTKQ